jgi:hypothetical protein
MHQLRSKAGVLSCAVVLGAASAPAPAAVSYTEPGSSYTQNFDSLPVTPRNANLQTATPSRAWADDTTTAGSVISIPGWYLHHATNLLTGEGGTNGHQRFRVSSAAATTGAFYSFGNNNSSAPFDPDGGDRALGVINSNVITTTTATNPAVAIENYQAYIGLRLTNDTGSVLRSFDVRFAGEQWRNAGVNAVQKLDFQYSLTAGSVSDPNASFVDVDALDFASPTVGTTAAGLNGNDAANRRVIAGTVDGFEWAPGQTLWLRWVDVNDGLPGDVGQTATTADHGLGIDDLTFTAAVPEPGGMAVLGAAAAGLLARRRRGA